MCVILCDAVASFNEQQTQATRLCVFLWKEHGFKQPWHVFLDFFYNWKRKVIETVLFNIQGLCWLTVVLVRAWWSTADIKMHFWYKLFFYLEKCAWWPEATLIALWVPITRINCCPTRFCLNICRVDNRSKTSSIHAFTISKKCVCLMHWYML